MFYVGACSIWYLFIDECNFHTFHYILVCTETSICQFRTVGLLASWSVGDLVVGVLSSPAGKCSASQCCRRL